MSAKDIIEHLGLEQHPEGGWYRQTWVGEGAGRPEGTCIYFLLADGEASHWHKVDATEIWFYHAGAPLVLSVSQSEAGPAKDMRLGPDVLAGEAGHLIVPKDAWQAARTTGDYTLVSCTVTPGFRFEGFTLAEAGFDIPRA
ncbi:cupin domain-containing protein [Nereida sp. MMG025]|uniref:cupin domain-containing protein n=1 Tax=Nereida sp. MMG025 TaxID=2909981 RepID=UPI001F2A7E8A|nr:cupin domain-containing protein [Nereida sp. MMG025]MCF6443468.1 cupin domain-containing protein [Nereida sp. MMG025]